MGAQELVEAIQNGDTSTVLALLEADASLANSVDDQGVNALMLALYHKQPDAVRALVAKGAAVGTGEAAALGDSERLAERLAAAPDSVSERSADGFTPLHFAAFFGHADAARRLLAAGADADASADNPSNLRPLHSACAARAADVVGLLLEHDPDVDARQAGGYTPLHAACKHGDVEVTKLLLAAGADASLTTDEGQTCLELAHEDVMPLLA